VARSRRLVYPVVGLLVVVLSFTTFTRAGIWSDKAGIVEVSLRNHPHSSRTHGEYATTVAARSGDEMLAYEHWTRAAELNPSSVLELVEMDKVIAARILAIKRGTLKDPMASDVADPQHYTDPVELDLDYLKALDLLVAGEVSTRLENRPMLMANVAALRTLGDCIRARLAHCMVLLPRAIYWHEIARTNPRLSNKARAVLAFRLARLYAFNGQVDKAAESAEAALRASPGHVVYLLELAGFYLAARDFDSAERTIAEAEIRMIDSDAHRDTLEALKNDLQKARVLHGGTLTSSR